MTLVLATRNAGKAREYRELLAGLPLCTRCLAEFAGMPPIAEGALSLEENAAAKAWAACRFTGLVALGEDTGLEVGALGGAPGVRAARYFGEGLTDAERVSRLLEALGEMPPPQRSARFRCVLAIVEPGGRQWAISGECRGSIAMAPRGSGGFGFDPVFEVEGTGCTLAELAPEAKNAVSHRGRAAAAARPILVQLAEEWARSGSRREQDGGHPR